MHRHSLLFLSVFFLSLTIVSTAHAATYYVSNSTANGWASGSDANNGTSTSTPKLTIAGAHVPAVNGDTVIVNDGSYTMSTTNLTKGITINPLHSLGTTLIASSTYLISIGITDGSTFTLGSFTVEGSTTANYGITVQDSATPYSVIFNGTHIQNVTKRGLDVRAKKVNVTANNVVINNPAGLGAFGAIEVGNGNATPYEQGTITINGGSYITNTVGSELNPAIMVYGTTTTNTTSIVVASTTMTVGAGSATNFAPIQIRNVGSLSLQNDTVNATMNATGAGHCTCKTHQQFP